MHWIISVVLAFVVNLEWAFFSFHVLVWDYNARIQGAVELVSVQ